MSDWPVVRIKDLGRVVTGKTPPTEAREYFDGNDLFISPKDLSWDQYYVTETETRISEKAFAKFKNQVLPPNAVLFTSLSFAFGKMGLTSRRSLTNQQINSIVVSDAHDYKFVFYLLKAYRPIIFSYNSGIDTPIVPKSVFEDIEVTCPTLETQQKIAAILSAYDDLIANNQRRITLLERMAEDIYREWFVRLRFPGHENVKIEKGVPQGWDVRKFRDVVQFYIGGGWGEEAQTATHSEPAYVIRGTDIPGLNTGDAQIGSLRFHTPSNLKSRLMHKGDLVFEVSGGSKDQLLGRNLLVSERLLRAHDNRVICASFCKMLRFNTALVSPYAMKYFFKLYYETDLVGLYQVQSTGISNYQFEAFLNYQTVLLPPMDLQAKFDAMVEPMLELKDDIALQTVILRRTRDALLPRLISGKLSVDALDIRFPPGMAVADA